MNFALRPVATHPFAYDFVRTADDGYRLELPVPGFKDADLEVEVVHRPPEQAVADTAADQQSTPSGRRQVGDDVLQRRAQSAILDG